MNKHKAEIILHHEYVLEWVASLEKITEEKWWEQIAPGKWSTAEVIGHLIPWDEFVLHKRMTYFFTEQGLPKSPNQQEVNELAAKESRSRSKAATIEKFLAERNQLLQAIKDTSEQDWQKELTIGTSTLTLYEYFKGLAQHDEHHFDQIKNVT